MPPPSAPADARELLAQFASTGRQEPFEEIVRRYGGMVFNLCYEVTGNRQDAEDAVQAAFLSLAVQTKSGTPVQAIGPWLQQVARRMSLDINRARKRRKNREAKHGEAWESRLTDASADGNGGSGGHGNPSSAAGWEELRTIVQQELNTLPPKYRMPLIMHYYGGLSREEMARELNCRANTLGVRLHRGREMLSKRLAKRGVTLSGVILGVLMAEVVHSTVTDRLVCNTAEAAVLLSSGHPYACGVVSPQIVALAQSATRALANAKIRFAATLALLAGGAAAAGAQVVSHAGAWDLGRKINWDIGRFFRNWLPTFAPPGGTRPIAETPDARPTPPPVAGGNDTKLPIGPLPVHPQDAIATPKPVPNGALPHWNGWNGIDWGGWDQRTPPMPQQNQAVAPRRSIAPGAPGLPQNNNNATQRGLPGSSDIARGGGSSGGGGGGSSGNDKDGGTKNKSRDRSPDGRQDDNVARDEKSPKENNPGRGGVKPRPTDDNIAKDGSPKPRAYQPDDVAHGQPQPPTEAHPRPPVVDPVVPQLPPPPGDAEQVTQPPATEDNANPHGGFISGDVLHVSSDFNPQAASFEQIRAAGRGHAFLQLGVGDAVTNKEVLVGHLGTGVAEQTGGVHTVDSLYLGVVKTGHGQYSLSGGELIVTPTTMIDPDAAPHAIEVGTAGEGVFLLGNADSTGRIGQPELTAAGATGVNLTVGALRSASGTFRGWGAVALTGRLANHGRIIADGYGQDRSLDFTSFSSVGNDFANRDTRGWFAVNHGRLDLPQIHVAAGTNTYTWGGSADDEKLSLVNSARVTLTGVEAEGTIQIGLLALDRTDVPTLPDGHHFIGVWTFDALATDGSPLAVAGGIDLTVRYDDALAAAMGLDENVLKLWKYDGQWERLDFDATFVRDPENHILSVHTTIDGMTHFAVSAPEPATIGLVAVGLSLLTLRRRRRS